MGYAHALFVRLGNNLKYGGSCNFRHLGYKKTILLDRRLLVDLIDKLTVGSLSWDEFSAAVKETHAHRNGQPTKRSVIPDRPKEEDYFYSNPQECLQSNDLLSSM